MPPTPRRLLDLKAWKLKHAAFLMGLPTTGSKTELDTVIRKHMYDRQHPYHGARVVSIDMGIRNLAICVLDVPPMDNRQPLGNEAFIVSHWLKRDLLTEDKNVESESTGRTLDGTAGEKRTGRRRRKPTVTASIPKTAFTPSVLSKTAYDITVDLLSYKPTVILIERQRFRSGGAAAIQEWTVRVNMLESMLWACLQTMREGRSTEGDCFPTVHEVSPARVAKFWTAAPDVSLRPPDDMLSGQSNGSTLLAGVDVERKGKKVQKNDKIAIVRSWLDRTVSVDVSLEFEGEAARTAEAFCVTKGRANRKILSAEKDTAIGKLDDLADCLLQAVAWVRWEENSRNLGRLLKALDQ